MTGRRGVSVLLALQPVYAGSGKQANECFVPRLSRWLFQALTSVEVELPSTVLDERTAQYYQCKRDRVCSENPDLNPF